MINQAFIYPYSRCFSSYLRHIEHFDIYNIVAAVAPGKWIKDTCDAGYIDSGEKIDIPLSTDFEYWLNKCDTVIWANYEYYENYDFYETVLLRIKNAMTVGKNIVCFEELTSDDETTLREIAKSHNVTFVYKQSDSNFDDCADLSEKNDVPVISVLGMAERCSKFDAELSLYRILCDKGYKVSLVSSKSNVELLGIQPFPSFMFSHHYSEIEKMNLFSNFVKNIIYHQRPDVIIIGIPGGIIPFNKQHNMHYGITAYEVLSIIKPDYTIVNVWADYVQAAILDDLVNICRYRYGIKINAIGVSNISIYNDHSTIERTHQEYNIYNLQYVDEKIASNGFTYFGGVKFYNILEKASMERLADDAIEMLSE